MAAFVFVGMIGFVVAVFVLPVLYVRSKNREIDLANPANAKLIRSWVGHYVDSKADQNLLKEISDYRDELVQSAGFDMRGCTETNPLTPDEVLKWLRAHQPSGSMDEVERILGNLKWRFAMIRFIPRRVLPLSTRLSVLADEETTTRYLPLLLSLSSPEKEIHWTLAVGKPVLPSMPALALDEKEIYANLSSVGLRYVRDLLFFASSDIQGMGEDFWKGVKSLKENEFFEPIRKTDNQRILFIPVDDLGSGDLAGLLGIIYEPTWMATAMKELLSLPASYLALVTAALVAVLFSYFYAKMITRPIQALTAGALAITQGRLDQEVGVSTRDEIGVLARTFNEMTDRLRTTLEQLRERAETIEKQNVELDRRFNQLNALQNYTEKVLQSVDSAIFSVDLSGKIRRPNRAAHDMLGLQDGQHLDDLAAEILRDRLTAALELGEITASEEILVNSTGGERVPVALSVSPLLEGENITGAVAVLTDLLVIKNLEAQVSRQERLAALGQLTAGVAHELRNPLSTIKACGEILEKRFGGQTGEEGLCRDIIDEVDRLSRVVTEFLTFARPSEPHRRTVQLNDLLGHTLDLVERGESGGVRFLRRFENPLPPVEADPHQIEQVVLNLVRNGIEAMKDTGAIELSTGFSTEDSEVWFEVRDQGEGMDEETRRRLFDPFYTTKASGTGLGLSICHRILEAHEGTIHILDTNPGKGTVIRVTFPLEEKDAIKEPEGMRIQQEATPS
jgi:PAS domain S-box-containing protein